MQKHFIVSELLQYLKSNPNSKVIFSDGAGRVELTYRDLHELVADRLRTIAELGIAGRFRIGLSGPNSLDWLAWDLAILSSGNIPVAFADEHASIAHEELMKRYACRALVSTVASGRGALLLPSEAAQETPLDPDDVLTLVFSSGTTGRTKGLNISKLGLEHILGQFIDAYRLTASDKYYSFLPFNYFQQRALYYAALAVGADIIVVPPAQFLQHFATEHPTYCINPPVFYEAIYKHYKARERLGHAVSLKELLGGNIRWMITAMAPIKRQVLDFFWEHGVGLYETYGVTETGLVAWNTLDDFKVGTVGKAAGDGDIVLSPSGEVLITRKIPLALGYFDAGGENETDVFRADGAIATGDIATVDADGYLTLVGRTKNAIITAQGKKFHPEQVESKLDGAIISHVPVVVGGVGIGENTLLLAPRSAEDRAPLSDATLSTVIDTLNDSLETHKRVRAVYVLDEPFSLSNGYLTRNFKVDRRALEASLLAGRFSQQRRRISESRNSQTGGVQHAS
jgi:long-chain acyl-CoA synthetase